MKIYIDQTCPLVAPVLQELDRLNTEYTQYDIDEDQSARAHLLDLANGYLSVPTIEFDDGTVMVEPTPGQLRQALNPEVSTTPDIQTPSARINEQQGLENEVSDWVAMNTASAGQYWRWLLVRVMGLLVMMLGLFVLVFELASSITDTDTQQLLINGSIFIMVGFAVGSLLFALLKRFKPKKEKRKNTQEFVPAQQFSKMKRDQKVKELIPLVMMGVSLSISALILGVRQSATNSTLPMGTIVLMSVLGILFLILLSILTQPIWGRWYPKLQKVSQVFQILTTIVFMVMLGISLVGGVAMDMSLIWLIMLVMVGITLILTCFQLAFRYNQPTTIQASSQLLYPIIGILVIVVLI